MFDNINPGRASRTEFSACPRSPPNLAFGRVVRKTGKVCSTIQKNGFLPQPLHSQIARLPRFSRELRALYDVNSDFGPKCLQQDLPIGSGQKAAPFHILHVSGAQAPKHHQGNLGKEGSRPDRYSYFHRVHFERGREHRPMKDVVPRRRNRCLVAE